MKLLSWYRRLPDHKRRALLLGGIGLFLLLASPLISSVETSVKLLAIERQLQEGFTHDPQFRLLLLGNGEREVVVYTWWGCPSCKAFFLERWESLDRGGSGFTFLVKPLHFQAEDIKKTATVLCVPEEERKRVFLRLLRGETFGSPSPECLEEAKALGEKAEKEWREGKMFWTPGIVVEGRPLAPSEMRKENLDVLFGKGE